MHQGSISIFSRSRTPHKLIVSLICGVQLGASAQAQLASPLNASAFAQGPSEHKGAVLQAAAIPRAVDVPIGRSSSTSSSCGTKSSGQMTYQDIWTIEQQFEVGEHLTGYVVRAGLNSGQRQIRYVYQEPGNEPIRIDGPLLKANPVKEGEPNNLTRQHMAEHADMARLRVPLEANNGWDQARLLKLADQLQGSFWIGDPDQAQTRLRLIVNPSAPGQRIALTRAARWQSQAPDKRAYQILPVPTLSVQAPQAIAQIVKAETPHALARALRQAGNQLQLNQGGTPLNHTYKQKVPITLQVRPIWLIAGAQGQDVLVGEPLIRELRQVAQDLSS